MPSTLLVSLNSMFGIVWMWAAQCIVFHRMPLSFLIQRGHFSSNGWIRLVLKTIWCQRISTGRICHLCNTWRAANPMTLAAGRRQRRTESPPSGTWTKTLAPTLRNLSKWFKDRDTTTHTRYCAIPVWCRKRTSWVLIESSVACAVRGTCYSRRCRSSKKRWAS